MIRNMILGSRELYKLPMTAVDLSQHFQHQIPSTLIVSLQDIIQSRGDGDGEGEGEGECECCLSQKPTSHLRIRTYYLS